MPGGLNWAAAIDCDELMCWPISEVRQRYVLPGKIARTEVWRAC